MVFLSWSKTLSNKLAIEFKRFASLVLEDENIFWISNNVKEGSGYFNDIQQAMLKSDISIVFLTRDNIANPWIHYELGFFGADNKLVIPIFFESSDIYKETQMTPFEHLQVKTFDKETMVRVFKTIKEKFPNVVVDQETINRNFDRYFDEYKANTINILNTTEYYDADSIDDIKFMLAKSLRLIDQDNKVLYFEHGFETNEFYSFALKNTKKRLYIFGRKNSKLFSRSNLEQFKRIAKCVKEDNYDLRILGMSPKSDEKIIEAAQKKRHFESALNQAIDNAIEIFDECGLDYKKHMRFYNAYRNALIVVMDNIVFFMNSTLDIDGKPTHLTDSPFYACGVTSAMGQRMLETFTDAYEKAEILDFE